MARYDKARFAPVAQAWLGAGMAVPEATDTEAIRSGAEAISKAVGADTDTGKAAHAVSTLRVSIARRFVTLSLAPLAAEQASKAPRTRKPKNTVVKDILVQEAEDKKAGKAEATK